MTFRVAQLFLAGALVACGGSGTMGGAGGGASGSHAPLILDAQATGAVTPITATTLVVTVSDPEGADDIVGGKLFSADHQHLYAPFVQQSAGTYSAQLTWGELNAVEPIQFLADPLKRSVLIEFADAAEHVTSAPYDVDVSCADTSSDVENCGGCGWICPGLGSVCAQGTCSLGVVVVCDIPHGQSCNDVCAKANKACGGFSDGAGMLLKSDACLDPGGPMIDSPEIVASCDLPLGCVSPPCMAECGCNDSP